MFRAYRVGRCGSGRMLQTLEYGFEPLSGRRRIFNITGKWDSKLNVDTKKEIEKYWMDRVRQGEEAMRRRNVDPGKPKYYVLSMFPYPSGNLHMGHVRVYAISDTLARMRRMQGYEVIHPMGWDAFGLPAENAALEKGMPAHVWTESNITHMKEQMLNMGFQFDWDREIRTCDESYYKWTQFLFLKLLDAGLAYQKEAFVNWDPVDKTVLANEQVDEKGCSWRSGAPVERRLLKQWFIKTSHYAKALREGLNSVPENWFDIVDLQKNWIGELDGYRVKLQVHHPNTGERLCDTDAFFKDVSDLHTAECLLVPSDHELCTKFPSTNDKQLSIIIKHPLMTEKYFPVFVSDGMKTGVYFEQANAMFGRLPNNTNSQFNPEATSLTDEEKQKSLKNLSAAGVLSGPISGRFRDWLISRQRYWGTPIPVVHCDKCGAVPVPYEELPVKLPLLEEISVRAGSILAAQEDWSSTKCPKCGGAAKRETDTMDTFVDSAWYYLRYLDPENSTEPFSPRAAAKYMPVDIYIGGKEHALMHLFYARFFGYFLYEQGLLPQPEPFHQLLTQGFVQGQSYRDKITGKYLTASEVDLSGPTPLTKTSGNEVVTEWEKMSKSKLNGLSPDDAIAEYGVDSTRLFMLGNIAPRSHRRWDPTLFEGLMNWQYYLWCVVNDFILRNTNRKPCTLTPEEIQKHEETLSDNRNYHLKGFDDAIDRFFGLNMAVTKLQGLTSSLRKVPPAMMENSLEFRRAIQQTIILSCPFTPHFASELWSGIKSVPEVAAEVQNKEVWEMDWPKIDKAYKADLVIQLYGEELALIKVDREVLKNMSSEDALRLALDQEVVRKLVGGSAVGDRVRLTKQSEFEAQLDLKLPEAAKSWKKQLKAEKAERKAAKKSKVQAA